MNRPILTVSELNNYIKKLMDHDIILGYVIIKGEISNFKHHYTGHMYLTLKDKNSVIRCVIFKSTNNYLRFIPKDGMKVIVRGRVTVYEKMGQYQLYVEDMQPDGVGSLHIAFEQLKNKFENEGLFKLERKKALPKFPNKIGVITSVTGAAVRDIIKVLKRRYPCVEVIIYPVLVQGDRAANQIAEAITYFNQQNNDVDCLIVGRGGGSLEELWAFNEEIVARSIADSQIPVISAVGHETDYTICDFISDVRAPTPSAAAEICVPSQTELIRKIQDLKTRITIAEYNYINSLSIKVKHLCRRITLPKITDKIKENRMLIDEISKKLLKEIINLIKSKRQILAMVCGKLNSLSPLAVLSRGYLIVKNEENEIVKSVESINIDDNLKIQLSDGIINCKVNTVRNIKDLNDNIGENSYEGE